MKRDKKQIEDINFILKTRMKPIYFTRDSAKMGFTDSMYFILIPNIRQTQQVNYKRPVAFFIK